MPLRVTKILRHEADYIWHKETDLSKYECIIIPGGFSYGTISGRAIARFSPIMQSIYRFVEEVNQL
ncbi:MAG: hypothetical protein CM1200mP15_05750 [Dehalococcoidia bacterium]|nr:MAG: hypothetical protein CM1200mP15_05750 [Dehalococcoidia bacterium]